MTAAAYYYFRDKPLEIKVSVNPQVYCPAMRTYFENFLIESSKIYDFEKAIFYINASSKNIEQISIYQGFFDPKPRLDKMISEYVLNQVFSIDLDHGPYLVVDRLITRVKRLFTEKMSSQDQYDIDVHVRLVGSRICSFSSDHYRLKIDFSTFKLKRFLENQGVKADEFPLKEPKVTTLIRQTSSKSLF